MLFGICPANHMHASKVMGCAPNSSLTMTILAEKATFFGGHITYGYSIPLLILLVIVI